MTANRNRTYRVPKRVERQVQLGIERLSKRGVKLGDDRALKVAEVLTSRVPVDISVALEINEFFTHDWRFHDDKARVAGLYGGDAGQQWARKCAEASDRLPPITASAEAPTAEDITELTTFTDADIQQLLQYGRLATVDGAPAPTEIEVAFETPTALPPAAFSVGGIDDDDVLVRVAQETAVIEQEPDEEALVFAALDAANRIAGTDMEGIVFAGEADDPKALSS